MFTRALVRRPGPELAAGLTTADLSPAGLGAPDVALAGRQFDAYVRALAALGLQVIELPALPGFPDAHFVEDTAVMLPDVAVVACPGAPSRDGEQLSVAETLADFGPVTRVEPPGTLDGGDVLQMGRHVLIGLSERTNSAGAVQLGAVVETHGGTWRTVEVGAGLHLKSSVNGLGDARVLVTSELAAHSALADYERIQVPPGEEYAANVLWINGTVLMPDGYPGVRSQLEQLGLPLVTLDTDEFRKLDGGLTCLSLRF